MMYWFSRDSMFSLGASYESKSLFLEFGGTKVGYLCLIRASLVRLKNILLEVSFPIGKISSLQGVTLKVFISLGRKDCSTKCGYF